MIALEEGLLAPLRREGRVGADAVDPLEDYPCALCRVNGGFLCVFDRFGHILCDAPRVMWLPDSGSLAGMLCEVPAGSSENP